METEGYPPQGIRPGSKVRFKRALMVIDILRNPNGVDEALVAIRQGPIEAKTMWVELSVLELATLRDR